MQKLYKDTVSVLGLVKTVQLDKNMAVFIKNILLVDHYGFVFRCQVPCHKVCCHKKCKSMGK